MSLFLTNPAMSLCFVRKVATLLVTLTGLLAMAQPSGGPYGPRSLDYQLPTNAAHIYYVAPDAKAEAAGLTLAEPTTIAAALAKVVTGDAIVLRGGIYRTGGLLLNQGITMQPYGQEKPVFKGTDVANNWVAQGNGLWRTSWAHLFPCKPRDWWNREREGMRTPLHRFNNDMVVVDGEALRSVGWEGELDDHSYYIDYETGQVYLRIDPTNRLVEITAWESALVCTSKSCHGKNSDHLGPTIRGLTFTQYAYRALEVEGKRGSVPATEEPTDDPVGLADPATFGKEIIGTTLEDVTITHCSRVGGFFRGDKLTIRHCRVSDTSTEGIYVIGSSDCLLEKNIFARNNVEQLTGYYPSAVKIFNQTRRVIFRDNLVIDQPFSNGVWYDVGNVDGVFVNNWIENCIDGFFFEISQGAICAGNVFVNCNRAVRVLNSANVRVYQNTLINTVASFERNERSAVGDHFGWHPSTGPDVDKREGHVFSGNLLVADASFSKALLRVEQASVLRGKLLRPPFTAVDFNLYVRPASPGGGTQPLVIWSPADGDLNQFEFAALAELQRKLPQFEAHSQSLEVEPGAVLRSPELKNFQPIRSLPVPAELPTDVVRLLGWPQQATYVPGAYQAAGAD